MTKAKESKVNAVLEKALTDLLKNVTSGHDADGKPYSLTDKCKVIDRVLKLEGLKAKLNDGDWGQGFSDD